MKLSKNFTDEEFWCPCCRKQFMQRVFIEKLQEARNIAEMPFRINSGWRCKEHNRFVGGSKDSSHLCGVAADISSKSSRTLYVIVASLIESGFTRIGVANTFIHVDCDTSKRPNRMWTY